MAKLLFKQFCTALMLTLCSFALTSCGGDDDDPKPNKGEDISTTGQLNTVNWEASQSGSTGWGAGIYYSHDNDVTIDVGCTLSSLTLYKDELGSIYSIYGLYVAGGKITYAGDFQNLTSVTTAPALGSSSWDQSAGWHDGGCYIVYSNTGNFIRLKLTLNTDFSVTVQFQTYVPTNL